MGENLITLNSVHYTAMHRRRGLEYGTGYSLLSSDSALGTLHSFSHSALSTLHSALLFPLSTQHFLLSTLKND
uniref:Uncharacterized protein n=1 Tax=Desertifilum tharense IPPAS B-1220 TaxID=1781255 RepID=A0ACD5GYW8_9CYAN